MGREQVSGITSRVGNAVIAPKYLQDVFTLPDDGKPKPKNQSTLYAKVGGLTLEVSRRNRAAVKQALRAKAGS